MSENKPRRLSEVVPPLALEGANDEKWMLIDHQLAQAKMSIQIARHSLVDVAKRPENDEEVEIAKECLYVVRAMYLAFLERYTTFLSYLSGTDVPDKISRKEL